MNILTFNTGCACNSNINKDVLSAFRQHSAKGVTIQSGMTVNEISDVVSDKIMGVVKEQFKRTEQKNKK